MGQTFRALCPAAGVRHVFELVSEGGHTKGWCTRCRQVWPLEALSDEQPDPAKTPQQPKRPSGKQKRKG